MFKNLSSIIAAETSTLYKIQTWRILCKDRRLSFFLLVSHFWLVTWNAKQLKTHYFRNSFFSQKLSHLFVPRSTVCMYRSIFIQLSKMLFQNQTSSLSHSSPWCVHNALHYSITAVCTWKSVMWFSLNYLFKICILKSFVELSNLHAKAVFSCFQRFLRDSLRGPKKCNVIVNMIFLFEIFILDARRR